MTFCTLAPHENPFFDTNEASANKCYRSCPHDISHERCALAFSFVTQISTLDAVCGPDSSRFCGSVTGKSTSVLYAAERFVAQLVVDVVGLLASAVRCREVVILKNTRVIYQNSVS